MTREFLQNVKVGDAPLPKEVVDAIMEENGRDIEAAKKPFADYESIKAQLQTATDGLKAFDGVDVKDLQGQIAKLTGDLATQKSEHEAKLADLAFDGVLKDAITAAHGRNAAAIIGALGAEKVSALKAGKVQDVSKTGSRTQDILGNVTVTNQYNFGLYYVLEKAPGGMMQVRRSTPTGSWTSRSGCRHSLHLDWPRCLGTIPVRSAQEAADSASTAQQLQR